MEDLKDMDNFELMDKIIAKGIDALKDSNSIGNDFYIGRQARLDIYTMIANSFTNDSISMDSVPSMVMCYLKGYDVGSKETVKRKSHNF